MLCRGAGWGRWLAAPATSGSGPRVHCLRRTLITASQAVPHGGGKRRDVVSHCAAVRRAVRACACAVCVCVCVCVCVSSALYGCGCGCGVCGAS